MEFKKRIGLDPHLNGQNTKGMDGCPDIWELSNGDFAIIGIRETNSLKNNLPKTAGCGIDEEIVVIPRELLIGAKGDIPNE